MGNTQYAVCHLQRGSGNDSGMSCHIERKDAKGKKYIPFNADANRTHLNRELVKFPDGVKNRTEAIQFRIDHAGLHRKVGKNQTKAIRIILTGTHEQMMKIADDGKLDKWIDANMKWLKDTFGSENLVSCVLHLDEKTPHLHATIVPIVTTERLRKKREGEKKYETKSGARLSADDVMRRTKLHEYQNSYAKTMKPFGLQRGIVGSTAKHQANSDYYRQQVIRYEEDIAKLQADVEKAQEGRNTILSWFGKGDLARAKKELSNKDEEIARLNKRLKELQAEKAWLQEQHKSEIGKLRNGYQKEIDKVVKVLQDGGLVVYPTDTVYAIGCDALNVRAVEKICQMKGVNPQKSNLSIICYDLSNLSEYAKVSNAAFKLMKKHLPGPFTFILPTSSELPKIYKNRKEVGIRVPDNNITRTLVQSLGNPILTMSIRDKDEVIEYTTDPELIHEKYEHQVDIVIDGGFGGLEASTVIDCTTDNFEIVRQGKGEL